MAKQPQVENLERLKILAGRKFFVTGHTGFKGGWLLAMLEELGAIADGYALPPAGNSIFHHLRFKSLQRSTYANILDIGKLTDALLQSQPDVIIHLAAQPLVLESYRKPMETFEVNTIGTGNLLRAMTRLERPCVAIVVTTDKVYANDNRKKPFSENDPLGGHDPYSASKAAAELITQSYRHSFFNPGNYRAHEKSVASVRSGNVIGGGDMAANRIVPDLVRAWRSGQKAVLRNPLAVRPWQHVLEPLNGYLLLAAALLRHPESEIFNAAWNFGPDPACASTVEDLARQMAREWGAETAGFLAGKPPVYEAGYLLLDSSKAGRHLNWYPRLNFAETVRLTAEWYRNCTEADRDMTILTRKQIHDYFHNLQ